MSKDIKTLILIILAAFILAIPLGRELAKKYGHITYAHGLSYYGPTEKLIYPK